MNFHRKSLGAYEDSDLGVYLFIGASYSEPGVYAFDFQHPAITGEVKSFEAIGHPIEGSLRRGDKNESHRPTIGFIFVINRLKSSFEGYANGDPERIDFATKCVMEVARQYLIDAGRVTDPIIELV